MVTLYRLLVPLLLLGEISAVASAHRAHQQRRDEVTNVEGVPRSLRPGKQNGPPAGNGGDRKRPGNTLDTKSLQNDVEGRECSEVEHCQFFTGYCGEGACECRERRRRSLTPWWKNDGDESGEPHKCHPGEDMVLCEVEPCTGKKAQCTIIEGTDVGYCEVLDAAVLVEGITAPQETATSTSTATTSTAAEDLTTTSTTTSSTTEEPTTTSATSTAIVTEKPTPTSTKTTTTGCDSMCTMDACICPDGSGVGRDGCNNCQFDPCLGSTVPCDDSQPAISAAMPALVGFGEPTCPPTCSQGCPPVDAQPVGGESCDVIGTECHECSCYGGGVGCFWSCEGTWQMICY